MSGEKMSDNLSERLKNLAKDHTLGKQAEVDQRKFQEQVEIFISDKARAEFDNLIRC
jgi:hypothetical protein